MTLPADLDGPVKPIWYLDVDGVINMVRSPALERGLEDVPRHCWRTRVVNGFPITWDTRVISAINELHRAGSVEICWLTTWESDAAKLLAPALEFDEFRVPAVSSRFLPQTQRGWWKWDSVRHHAEDDHHDQRAIIWTDDDLEDAIAYVPDLAGWFGRRGAQGLVTLGISPEPARGLTIADLEAIRSVCADA